MLCSLWSQAGQADRGTSEVCTAGASHKLTPVIVRDARPARPCSAMAVAMSTVCWSVFPQDFTSSIDGRRLSGALDS